MQISGGWGSPALRFGLVDGDAKDAAFFVNCTFYFLGSTF